jgi:flagellar biosynthesis/type III secretory pathway M-ring protein FliF/YscJ
MWETKIHTHRKPSKIKFLYILIFIIIIFIIIIIINVQVIWEVYLEKQTTMD